MPLQPALVWHCLRCCTRPHHTPAGAEGAHLDWATAKEDRKNYNALSFNGITQEIDRIICKFQDVPCVLFCNKYSDPFQVL